MSVFASSGTEFCFKNRPQKQQRQGRQESEDTVSGAKSHASELRAKFFSEKPAGEKPALIVKSKNAPDVGTNVPAVNATSKPEPLQKSATTIEKSGARIICY
jgi:hypothetical protein